MQQLELNLNHKQFKVLRLEWRQCRDTGEQYSKETFEYLFYDLDAAQEYARSLRINNDLENVDYTVEEA